MQRDHGDEWNRKAWWERHQDSIKVTIKNVRSREQWNTLEAVPDARKTFRQLTWGKWHPPTLNCLQVVYYSLNFQYVRGLHVAFEFPWSQHLWILYPYVSKLSLRFLYFTPINPISSSNCTLMTFVFVDFSYEQIFLHCLLKKNCHTAASKATKSPRKGPFYYFPTILEQFSCSLLKGMYRSQWVC